MMHSSGLSRGLALGVLLLVASLYLRSLQIDLPYRYVVDEDYFYLSAISIWESGLQEQVYYPPLGPYMSAAVYKVMELSYGGDLTIRHLATLTYFGSRLLSAFCALLAGSLLFALGRRLDSAGVGLLAMGLFLLDPQVYEFAHTMRGDTAAYLLMTAALLCFLLALERQEQATRWRWLCSLTCLLAILGKYSVAPIAIFPAYLWVRHFFPAWRHQLMVGGVLALGGLGLILLLRQVAQSQRAAFAGSGFDFILVSDLLQAWKLEASLQSILAVQPPLFVYSAVLLTGLALLLCWRLWRLQQRLFVLLLLIMCLGTLLIFSMTPARYRDIFVVPYALMLLWALSLSALLRRFLPRLRSAGLLLGGLLLLVPLFWQNWQSAELLRQPNSRIPASQWLLQQVEAGARIYKEHESGYFLPHVSGFEGPYYAWTHGPAPVFERPAADWWAEGYAYVMAEDTVSADYFQGRLDAAALGYSLAYRTPPDWPGAGPQLAIFYTFPIQQQVDYPFPPAASLFGFSIDEARLCPGEVLVMRLFWRALSDNLRAEYQTRLSLHADADGTLLAQNTQLPMADWFPSTAWRQYNLLFDDHRLPLPPDAAPGPYSIQVALYDPAQVANPAAAAVRLASIEVLPAAQCSPD